MATQSIREIHDQAFGRPKSELQLQRGFASCPTPLNLTMAGAQAPAIPRKYRSLHNAATESIARVFDEAISGHADYLKGAFQAGLLDTFDLSVMMDATRPIAERADALQQAINHAMSMLRGQFNEQLQSVREQVLQNGVSKAVIKALDDCELEFVNVYCNEGTATLSLEVCAEPLYYDTRCLNGETLRAVQSLIYFLSYSSFGESAEIEIPRGAFGCFEEQSLTADQIDVFKAHSQAIASVNWAIPTQEDIDTVKQALRYLMEQGESLAATDANLIESMSMNYGHEYDSLASILKALEPIDPQDPPEYLEDIAVSVERALDAGLVANEFTLPVKDMDSCVAYLRSLVPTTDAERVVKAIFDSAYIFCDSERAAFCSYRADIDWYYASFIHVPCHGSQMSPASSEMLDAVMNEAMAMSEYADTYNLALNDPECMTVIGKRLTNLYLTFVLHAYLGERAS